MSGPIDLNTATPAELEELPGIGPATATAIVEHRERHGPFASVDDLSEVSGIGPAKLEAIRESGTGLRCRARPSDAQYSDSPRITVAAINEPAAPSATPTNIHAYSRQYSRHVAIGERVARREAIKPINNHSGVLATTANG